MYVQTLQGGQDALDSLLYRPPDEATINYMQSKLHDIWTGVKDIGNRFKESAKRLFDTSYSAEAIQRAKRYLLQADYALADNVITRVSQESYKNINPFMQRYLMDLPSINDLYNRNLCNGFPDTYVDTEPNVKGEDRELFQDATDGILRFDKAYSPFDMYGGKDNDNAEGFIMHYTHTREDELSNLEKFAIHDLWQIAQEMMEREEDPTDI